MAGWLHNDKGMTMIHHFARARNASAALLASALLALAGYAAQPCTEFADGLHAGLTGDLRACRTA